MLFNSFVFVVFFVVVYGLFLLGRRRMRFQNSLLLVASYVFYGWWDWRFLSLIALSTVIDYVVGRALNKVQGERRRKQLVSISVVSNLGILGFFKYFNFFADSFVSVFSMLGVPLTRVELEIVLPVGISFYTFQTLAYTIDVYRRNVEPVDDFWDFALYVSFFPQLVAGPIERAFALLPQIRRSRHPSWQQVDEGLSLVAWGFFKKLVVADNVARIANQVFNDYQSYQGLDLFVAIVAFALQIYCDFSGYSDIARGISKLMGFELMVNFRLPYFALNPSDFWSRWHISLSTWLRDYLYVPLGGNRAGKWQTLRNLFLTMVLGGLWHGASYNFVLWGAFHGGILILYRVFDKRPEHKAPWSGEFSYARIAGKWALMLSLTLVGWTLFRCSTTHQIWWVLSHLGVSRSTETSGFVLALLGYGLPLVLMEAVMYVSGDLLVATRLSPSLRGALYGALVLGIAIFGVRQSQEFIYFQF